LGFNPTLYLGHNLQHLGWICCHQDINGILVGQPALLGVVV
jgi:hypothetical protein